MTIDYTPETYTHTLKNGETITVRGLSLEHMGALVRDNGELMEMAFEGTGTALKVVTHAPALAAQMIALGAGDPKGIDTAARLPFPLQLVLVAEIFRLTFGEIPMGNAVRLLMEILMSLKQANNENPDT